MTDDFGNSVAIAAKFFRWCEGRSLLPTSEPNGNQAASWTIEGAQNSCMGKNSCPLHPRSGASAGGWGQPDIA
eukprot:630664-Pyramimonas_sp.AAC.1